MLSTDPTPEYRQKLSKFCGTRSHKVMRFVRRQVSEPVAVRATSLFVRIPKKRTMSGIQSRASVARIQ